MITREHGAWVIILIPVILAGVRGGTWFPGLLLLCISSLAVFMSYVPVQTLLRRSGPAERRRALVWVGAFLSIGVASALPLVVEGRPLLLLFGAAGVGMFFLNFFLTRRVPRTPLSDLVAVGGLTLTGPAGLYVVSGSAGSDAFLLWLICFLFFGGTVFHVHMRIAARGRNGQVLTCGDRLHLGRSNLFYQGIVVASIGTLALTGVVPWLTVGAFAPMTIQAATGMCRLNRWIRFKNLGLLLLFQSVAFGAVIAIVL
jgi:hypothetical protein